MWASFLSSEVVALGADVSPLEAVSVQLSTWLSETQDVPRALSCPLLCQLPWAVGTLKCSQQGVHTRRQTIHPAARDETGFSQ